MILGHFRQFWVKMAKNGVLPKYLTMSISADHFGQEGVSHSIENHSIENPVFIKFEPHFLRLFGRTWQHMWSTEYSPPGSSNEVLMEDGLMGGGVALQFS